MIGSHYRLRI